jgi:hypothetical protein
VVTIGLVKAKTAPARPIIKITTAIKNGVRLIPFINITFHPA